MHIFALFFLENELRTLNSTRYLYTAKRGNDGKLIYLIDGLDIDAEDFANCHCRPAFSPALQ